MERYIRGDKKEIPEKFHSYLSDAQRAALDKVAQFGWSIAFIRRPLFQDPVVVMINETGNKYAVLMEDGNLDQEPDISFRPEKPSAKRRVKARKARNQGRKSARKTASAHLGHPIHKAS